MRLLCRATLAAMILGGAAQAAPPTPRQVVQTLLDAINRHDTSHMADLYAPDAVLVESDTCAPIVGRDAIVARAQAHAGGTSDLKVRPVAWVEQGDRVALLYHATSEKVLGPTGKLVLADFFTVRDGRILRDETIYNVGRPCR